VRNKKLQKELEKQRKVGELAELRCVELEHELNALRAQRNTNFQQFEQLKKQFTETLVHVPAFCCLTAGRTSNVLININYVQFGPVEVSPNVFVINASNVGIIFTIFLHWYTLQYICI